MKNVTIKKPKIITVQKPFVKTEENVPIETKLTWYDMFYGKMLIFEGTKLTFNYQEEEFVEIYHYVNGVPRLIKRVPASEASEEQKRIFGIQKKYIVRPKAETLYKKKTKNEKSNDAIQNLFEEYKKSNNTEIDIDHSDNYSVEFSVPYKEVSNFIYELYKHRMEYDIK